MRFVTLVVAGSILAFCAQAGAQEAKPVAPAKGTEVHGVDPANLDAKVKPCEDFYGYATGGWVARNPMPPAYPRWGTFDELSVRNTEALHVILESLAKDEKSAAGSIERKLADFYTTAMDEKKAEELGAKPIQPELSRIAAIKDLKELSAEAARLQRHGVGVLFRMGSDQDDKDATLVIASFRQGGLSLPDRDYYLKDDAKSKAIRDAYLKHVAKVFELLGDPAEKAASKAQTVLNIETALAKISMPRVEMREPEKVYHPSPFSELEKIAPAFDWKLYAGEIGLPQIKNHVNIGQPDFFKGLSEQLKATPLADWKVYLSWHLASFASPCLSSDFVKEGFDFRSTLTGTKEDLPRWMKVVRSEEGAMGMALGQIYVKEYFGPEAKAKVLDILHNIKAALRDDLRTLSWMSEPTRITAIAKLDKIAEKIGYPDKWRDYSGLAIGRASYFENVWNSSAFEEDYDLSKIGKPVDRTEWDMTPPTVNAYYNEHLNEIVFPAGILQPPFFDPKADDAANYGAIGVVIGHEITHGFDDQGAKYDGEGNLKNWWTPEDLKAFKERGECIADQYSGYVVDGDVHLQGKLVEGEAIADLGGVTLAMRAYMKSLEGRPAPAPVDGFTPEQRFFLAFANVWAGSVRPQFARMLATVDPHPPAKWRVNGTLANVGTFSKAFGCEQGPMANAADKQCQIW